MSEIPRTVGQEAYERYVATDPNPERYPTWANLSEHSRRSWDALYMPQTVEASPTEGAESVRVQFLQSVDPTQDDRPTPDHIFNKEYVDVPPEQLQAVQRAKKPVMADAIRQVHEQGMLSHLQLIMEDRVYISTSAGAFEATLPHLGTRRLRYIAPVWECRNYAALFCCVVTAVLGVSSVGKVLDFAGEHSYNSVFLTTPHGLQEFLIEPQSDRLVQHLSPEHHYTGKGALILGG